MMRAVENPPSEIELRAARAARRAEEKEFLPTFHTRRRSSTPLPEEVDVAIVGAGTGGLCAGAYLAQAGLKVALFDRHYVAGGCGTCFARGSAGQRYIFDIGLHYLGECQPGGVYDKLLDPLGIHIDWAELPRTHIEKMVFPDFEFCLPATEEAYRGKLVELFPEELKGIDKYFRMMREIASIQPLLFHSGGRVTPAILWHIVTRARLLMFHEKATAAKFLDGCTHNQKLRAILLAQHGAYGLPPSEVSILLHAGLANHYLGGAWYPRGGGQTISNKLADTIEAAGGTIHLRRGIETILIEGGRAVGVRTEPRRGEQHEIRAKFVVSNADIKRTLVELIGPDHLSKRWLCKEERWTMPSAMVATFLGVTGDLTDLGMTAGNTLQFDDYDPDAYYLANRDNPRPMPRGCYITNSSLKEPGSRWHAPPGHQSVTIMAMLPGEPAAWGVTQEQFWDGSYKKEAAYQERKLAIEDDLIQRFDDLYPGAAARVVFRETATPASHTFFTSASGGTGYGLAGTPKQFQAARPDVKSPIKNLYWCGASTRTGHGIMGGLLSGRLVGRQVAVKLGVTPVP
jgi:phytoene dehydrogenase-like protein